MSISKGTAILDKIVPECLVISPKGTKIGATGVSETITNK